MGTIEALRIQNFKSVKDVQLNCKRVNVFIGEPNTGKSNLLEALALFALPYTGNISPLIRNSDLSNLFFENDLSNTVSVSASDRVCLISYNRDLVFFRFAHGDKKVNEYPLQLTGSEASGDMYDFQIHPYFFRNLKKFHRKGYDFLFPPNGDNLFSILQTNKSLRLLVSNFVQDRGFKLTFRQATSEIEISKEEDNILTTYPFEVISDTLQRIIFFLTAMESNKAGTTLIFEEPESNVFPYYTKILAERISRDESKQYFISTHNPVFLKSLIEKTNEEQIVVNLVDMFQYQTKVTQLDSNGNSEILNLGEDVFLNFDKLLSPT